MQTTTSGNGMEIGRLGDAGFPILGYDVNHDGKLDLIYGQGHGYGLYWLEQAGTPSQSQVDTPHD